MLAYKPYQIDIKSLFQKTISWCKHLPTINATTTNAYNNAITTINNNASNATIAITTTINTTTAISSKNNNATNTSTKKTIDITTATITTDINVATTTSNNNNNITPDTVMNGWFDSECVRWNSFCAVFVYLKPQEAFSCIIIGKQEGG